MDKKNIIPRIKTFVPAYGLLNQARKDLTPNTHPRPSRLGVNLAGIIIELGRDIPTTLFTYKFGPATGAGFYMASTYIADKALTPFRN
ncbi:hypothetical protein HN747_03930 [archaeon]|jgi:hypothetical protein|nr:hypothetical protein [archaeon]